ncbi:MAG: heme biosynthesis HemY N-terminal domain-containing protein [Comamonas sp.]
MRAALWFLILFAVAVALALFAGPNASSVTVFYAPYRVDLSLNLVLVLLLAAFGLLHVALRALAALFELPRQARRWRAQQKERAMHTALLEAQTHLLAGRFLRARKSADLALHQEASLREQVGAVPHGPQVRGLAHVVAADGAHALQDVAARDQHLQQLLDDTEIARENEIAEGARLRAANWALDDQRPDDALRWLEQLPQGVSRRMATQRVRLKAARLARQPAVALETARVLIRHRAYTADAGASLLKSLAGEVLRQAHDFDQLEAAWQALEPAERLVPEIASIAAERALRLAAEGESAPALAAARRWLEGVWPQYESMSASTQERFVGLLEATLDASDTAWLARIEAAQTRRPHDAHLQYLAGMACVRRQLWGKAQQLLGHASSGLTNARMRRHVWLTLAAIASDRGDADTAQAAIQQAARI